MPKALEELKSFFTGIISSPSTLDIPKEAATYSLNIDADVEKGTLSGIADNKLLGDNSWENPRHLVYRMKLLTHDGGFSVNNYQRQWFHFDTYNQRYWVWLAQDDSTTDWIDGSSGRLSEYSDFIVRERQEEVRIALTGSSSTTDVATKIAAALTALGPVSNSFLYNEVATTWFTAQAEIISDIPHVKLTSNYYGDIDKPSFGDPDNYISSEAFRKLRAERNTLLSQTDWWGASDQTMTDDQKAYRQKLRDFPSTTTPELDENGELTDVTWPSKPE